MQSTCVYADILHRVHNERHTLAHARMRPHFDNLYVTRAQYHTDSRFKEVNNVNVNRVFVIAVMCVMLISTVGAVTAVRHDSAPVATSVQPASGQTARFAAPGATSAAANEFTPVHALCLKNDGAFVCRWAVRFSTDGGRTWAFSKYTGDICVGQKALVDLSCLGVPDSSLVSAIVIKVVFGADNSATAVYQYDSKSTDYAGYRISGVLWKNTVTYTGMNAC